MQDPNPQFLVVAGEASGDLHGSSLVHALKKYFPAAAFCGMGGTRMRKEGVKTFFDIERMGAVGLVEVLGEVPHHLKVYRKLSREIASGKFAAVILIDYPTMNLRLAKCGRRADCPVFFFISPQVWAWRKGRIRKIREWVRRMFVVLPFEEAMYQEAGVDAEFLGHPFVDQVRPAWTRDEAFREFGLAPGKKTIGILPGSRKNEIESLLPVMVDAGHEIRREIPDCQFVLPVSDSVPESLIRDHLGANPLGIRLLAGKAHEVMKQADFLIIASGSATLEAGLLGCPMVLIYKLHPLTYWVAKRLVKTPFIGLVNLVAGESVAPELIQEQVTAQNIAARALDILKDDEKRQAVSKRLLQVREKLGDPGVMSRVAASIARALGANASHDPENFSY
jgi:lipid-A-disaccharide synthase